MRAPTRSTGIAIGFKEEVLSSSPQILVYGEEGAALAPLSSTFRIAQATDEFDAKAKLGSEDFAILVLGSQLPPERARSFLRDPELRGHTQQTVNIVFCMGPEPALFQDLVNEDELFYLAAGPGTTSEMASILRGAVARCSVARRTGVPSTESSRHRQGSESQMLLEFVRQVGLLSDPSSAARLVEQTATRLLRADHTDCLLHDVEANVLWANQEEQEERREESAVAGLIGFVASSGAGLVLNRIGDDPRYDRESDNPHGDDGQRCLAAAIQSEDTIFAVVMVFRDRGEPPFEPADLAFLTTMGTHVVPLFRRHTLEAQVAAELQSSESPYRQEALAHHANAWHRSGGLLERPPRWLLRTHVLLLAGLVASVLFLCLIDVNDYAEGHAIVRAKRKALVTSRHRGTVSSVNVEPGQRVRLGQELLRLYDEEQRREVDRLRQELSLLHAQQRHDAGDDELRKTRTLLRTELASAQASLDERTIRAPEDGTIAGVRVRPGQSLAPGDQVLSLVPDTSAYELFAVIPGHVSPHLRAGQHAHFAIDGYRSAEQLRLSRVSDTVVGPSEARQYIGEATDSLPIRGSVLLVHANITGASFRAEGRAHAYHDGMQGRVTILLRSEPAILALVPGLRSLFD